jgi:hypothetical protein
MFDPLRLRTAAVILLGVLIAAPFADASPRFTATNKTQEKINVYIFAGTDSVCSFEEKLKRLSAGETDQYGCTGGGKGQCKVQFYAQGSQICKSDGNTCSGNASKMKGKSKVEITTVKAIDKNTGEEYDKYVCDFSS